MGYQKHFSIQTHTLLLSYSAVEEPERKELLKGYITNRPEDFLDVGSPFFIILFVWSFSSDG